MAISAMLESREEHQDRERREEATELRDTRGKFETFFNLDPPVKLAPRHDQVSAAKEKDRDYPPVKTTSRSAGEVNGISPTSGPWVQEDRGRAEDLIGAATAISAMLESCSFPSLVKQKSRRRLGQRETRRSD
ncbi:hypothetical protein YC2023_114785 [Brassica napus]